MIQSATTPKSTLAIGAVYTHGLWLISSNRGGTKRYFHYDGLGSTHALTDSTGATTDTYTYSAFGVQESSTGSLVNPYRYVGQWGYYDDGARGSGYGLNCTVENGFYRAVVGLSLNRPMAAQFSLVAAYLLDHKLIYPLSPPGRCRSGSWATTNLVNWTGPITDKDSCGDVDAGVAGGGLAIGIICHCTFVTRPAWWVSCTWKCINNVWVRQACKKCSGQVTNKTLHCPPGLEQYETTKTIYDIWSYPCVKV